MTNGKMKEKKKKPLKPGAISSLFKLYNNLIMQINYKAKYTMKLQNVASFTEPSATINKTEVHPITMHNLFP